MLQIVRSVLAPIISLALYVLGVGLFTTFVSVKLKLADQGPVVIGLNMAAFSTGMVLGCLYSDRWIRKVGHIRSFAVFAATTAAFTTIMSLTLTPVIWLPCRLVLGFCAAGLYVVIESWLLHLSTPDNRGRVLSIYMTTFYAAQSGGQFLLLSADPKTMFLFALPAILCSLSVCPVSTTRCMMPPISESNFLKIRELLKTAPVGIYSAFASGMILGVIYGLFPIYLHDIGLGVKQVGVGMGVVILGGLALQWPVGALSDKLDRRLMIATISIATTVACGLLAFSSAMHSAVVYAVFFCFGGMSFALYPLSISHTSDRVEKDQFLAMTASLLLFFGVGSIAGPVVAPVVMRLTGPGGLLIFIACASLSIGLFAIYRKTQQPSVAPEDKLAHIPLPRAGTLSGELAEVEPVRQDEAQTSDGSDQI